MELLYPFLYEIGAAVCHQLPARSFFGGGRQMPLCARCTGLYTGVFFAFCFFLWKRRQNGDTPFSARDSLLGALALLPIAADGFGSYIGLWESSQLMRVLTGAAAGAALPAFFLLAGNFDPKRKPGLPIYASPRELPLLLAAALSWGLLLWLRLPLHALGAVFSIAGEVCLWAGVIYILLRALLSGKRLPFWRLSAGLAFCALWCAGRIVFHR